MDFSKFISSANVKRGIAGFILPALVAGSAVFFGVFTTATRNDIEDLIVLLACVGLVATGRFLFRLILSIVDKFPGSVKKTQNRAQG
jgi:hypothetical protein